MIKLSPDQYTVDRRQEHVVTNNNLIFIKQLEFSTDILEEIQNYNYKTILDKMPGTGLNFHTGFDNGGAKVVGLNDWHTVLKQDRPQYLDSIKQLIIDQWKDIDPNALVEDTLRTNLNVVVNTNRPSGVHLDLITTWTNEWTALVHLNDSDGPTEFVASKIMQDQVVASVPFKAGCLIIFPSVYAHRGSIPSAKDRYSLNYIFKVDTWLNELVLKR